MSLEISEFSSYFINSFFKNFIYFYSHFMMTINIKLLLENYCNKKKFLVWSYEVKLFCWFQVGGLLNGKIRRLIGIRSISCGSKPFDIMVKCVYFAIIKNLLASHKNFNMWNGFWELIWKLTMSSCGRYLFFFVADVVVFIVVVVDFRSLS